MSTRSDSSYDPTPWYRQRWPWLLMVMPGVSMVLGFVLLYLAITTNDGLVVDDYYRQGRAIDQTIARSVVAAEQGLAADVGLRAEDIRIALNAKEGVELPAELIVTIIHPTRAGFDQVLRLPRADGEYAGRIAPMTLGRWHVQIEDPERAWRLHGDVRLPDETQVRILPYDV
ncbi:MAG: FixH family protein [Zoogloeaceae bacterium]|nr:FixH family protein [Zoogloeaceae bacterium]